MDCNSSVSFLEFIFDPIRSESIFIFTEEVVLQVDNWSNILLMRKAKHCDTVDFTVAYGDAQEPFLYSIQQDGIIRLHKVTWMFHYLLKFDCVLGEFDNFQIHNRKLFDGQNLVKHRRHFVKSLFIGSKRAEFFNFTLYHRHGCALFDFEAKTK